MCPLKHSFFKLINVIFMAENLAYVEEGNGKSVILLHGFCENKAIWQQLMSELSPRARLLAPDLPGFGENTAIHGDMSIDNMAEQIAAWMDEQTIASAPIIGHSLGGYVALALADRFPEKVSRLCLFHSTAQADSQEKQRKRDQTIKFLEANGVATFVKNFIPSLFAPAKREHMKSTIDEVIALAAQTPDATAIAVTRAMRDRPERLEVLKKAAFPCLFIAGREDSAVPYEDMKQQSQLPAQAQLITLENCGHMGMYENPEDSREALYAFISS
jgi:pimeloyl-ACP methyl ester carboxylesterase